MRKHDDLAVGRFVGETLRHLLPPAMVEGRYRIDIASCSCMFGD